MFPQSIFNGFVTAADVLLLAVAFVAGYRIHRFFNFAYGGVFAFGGYVGYTLYGHVGCGLVLSSLVACAASGVLCTLLDLVVFRPLKRVGSGPMALLLASLGALVVVQNIISIVWGDEARRIPLGQLGGAVSFFGIQATTIQVLSIGIVCVVTAAFAWALNNTRTGLAFRALADDPALLCIMGAPLRRLELLAAALCGCLAGAAGVLTAADNGLAPSMGLATLMIAAVGGICGGVQSSWGALPGCLLVGLLQQFGGYAFGFEWQEPVVFLVLILFLLLRPQGLFGVPQKRTVV